MTEAVLQARIIDLARWTGWWHHHHHDARRSTPGWPDLVLLRPPDVLFIELKSDRGRLTVEQRTVLDQLTACGLETHVWRPVDWPAIQQRLTFRAVSLQPGSPVKQ